MFNKVPLQPRPAPLELSFSKRPKPLPRDIEEWLQGQECLTIDEPNLWPIECSTSVTLLDSPLQGECPALFKADGDKFLSLEAIREDLEKHSCKCGVQLRCATVQLTEPLLVVHKFVESVLFSFVLFHHMPINTFE